MPIPTSTTNPTSPPPARSTPPPSPARGAETFQPLAAVFAFLLPGAGHAILGETRRAGLIALGVLGLFLGGLIIGGIDVVDRKENPIWFFGQAMVGPLTFGVNYVHQNRLKVVDPADGTLRSPLPALRDDQGRVVREAEVRGPGGIAQPGQPGQRPPKGKALGRMHELGTLFITIAGMLNLIAILDAAFFARGDTGRDRAIENARRFKARQGGQGEGAP